ncbi:MAG TPA: endonuclease/exonuclease/phosphatase family protein [Segeticoccus sp.]|uniref:endonuclease/exonuclease/phosphatase family protein n=1 Tax=Segeticoccus sp. TaxID=2706531 RepID=UPI002D802AEA|nr:endonuclease/exonuclease/phosphatase family protein [Segeticoccus sp.]HET8601062.1 endonuclease/exonuclease/phosphatase family protein [Segeticoccus sp.]
MFRQVLLVAAAAAMSLGAAVPAAHATTVPAPGRPTSVTARPGPGAGQVTFSWRSDGSHTTGFRIETGLSSFSPYSPGLPLHGRHTHYFYVKPERRSVTLTASQLAAAGAPVGSANHLYYRLVAINRTSSGVAVRDWPYLQSVAVQPPAAPRTGTPLRVASFNVRTATNNTPGRTWLQRVPLIAQRIMAYHPGVVTLQELDAGRADGLIGPLTGHVRQTTSLVNALAAQGGGRYRLVRTTRYTAPYVPTGQQGARILYDTDKYRLVSRCSDTTNGAAWSSSCVIAPPVLAGEANARRWAAYAVLEDRATGKRFYVVSVHLDPRHSSTLATEQQYEQLRESQVSAVMSRINALNSVHLPVVLAGDLNSAQNSRGGDRAHDALVAAGYFDTAAAATRVRTRYMTFNNFSTTLRLPASGWGNRIDAITVKGIHAANGFNNVMRVTDANRPSDHNMVVADVRLP